LPPPPPPLLLLLLLLQQQQLLLLLQLPPLHPPLLLNVSLQPLCESASDFALLQQLLLFEHLFSASACALAQRRNQVAGGGSKCRTCCARWPRLWHL